MRFLLISMTATIATLFVPPGRTQLPQPDQPIFGVDYSFERMVASRTINDSHDQGKVSLVSYVYRPLKKDAGVVVMALHGSTGGWASPAEPLSARQVPTFFLLEQGFTVVFPLRRGRSESSGTYVEECPYHMGKCSLAEYRSASEAGLNDALDSTDAVFQQIVLAKLKPRDGRVLLLGVSRGGFVALNYAAAHPKQVQGVIAISPGLFSISDVWPEAENAKRLSVINNILSRVGAAYKGPTLWVYAARDAFYRDSAPPQFFASFERAGGRGEFVFIDQHSLSDGHVPPFDLWQSAAERFLRSVFGE